MNKHNSKIIIATITGLIINLACNAAETVDATASSETHRINADVWADNWFALYVDEKLVMEEGMTCYKAAKQLNMPYQNAKQALRKIKLENSKWAFLYQSVPDLPSKVRQEINEANFLHEQTMFDSGGYFQIST